MLNFKRMSVAVLATSAVLAAGVAAAEQREIIIFNGTYFPEKTNAQVGDTIVFYNQTGFTQFVEGDGWSIGPIPNGGRESVQIDQPFNADFVSMRSSGHYFKGYVKAGGL